MSPSTRYRLWAGFNLLGLLVTLVMNGLANALPLNGKTTGELSAAYPNLFVPAGVTFSIWGVIYLLLMGFVGFQLVCAIRGNGERAALDRVGPWFVVSSAANSLWIVAWHYEHPGLALVLMLTLLGSLLAMYLRLGVGRTTVDRNRRLLVELPISVYLGWITVATIANVTALLVDLGYGDLPPGPVFWTVAVVLVAVLLGSLMVVTRNDLAFAAVILWALLGIVIKRRAEALTTDDAVEVAAIAGMVFLGVVAVAQWVRTRGDGGAAQHKPTDTGAD